MGDDPGSPFLSLPATAWLASNDLAFAIFDRYPVSEGHTLVIPKRLVASWWDATKAEQHALLALAEQVKQLLEGRYAPDGWNLGVNVGAAAGQTVDHLHLHLIPRYDGDVRDPRGGIRHAIPSRGNWQTLGAEPSAGYDSPDRGVRLFDGVRRPLGVQLTALLRDRRRQHRSQIAQMLLAAHRHLLRASSRGRLNRLQPRRPAASRRPCCRRAPSLVAPHAGTVAASFGEARRRSTARRSPRSSAWSV